jgi:mono/diheme cytochrome c family protein
MSLKQKAIVIMMPMALAASAMFTAGAGTGEGTFHAATTYKSKCAACHGAKAEKKFDPSKSDDELVQIILKGKKAEKPPHMPGYETKGIHTKQAKLLLDHMKSLRQ